MCVGAWVSHCLSLSVCVSICFPLRHYTTSKTFVFMLWAILRLFCFHNTHSFRLVKNKHPKNKFKCLIDSPLFICICIFQLQQDILNSIFLKMIFFHMHWSSYLHSPLHLHQALQFYSYLYSKLVVHLLFAWFILNKKNWPWLLAIFSDLWSDWSNMPTK